MPRAIRKEKASKQVMIIFAIIALLTFIFKEVLQTNFKDLHDSLATAETQYRTETNRTSMSVQMLATQQQLEALTHRSNPNDYSLAIAQDTSQAREAESDAAEYLDEVSRLIDKLPAAETNLRAGRESLRKSIQQLNQLIEDDLKNP